nr:unnamed protein product [Callosobruchus analis]CAI5840974.1 unnamed protein product [Callosobruchus analis]
MEKKVFTTSEKALLLNLVDKFKDLIENKKTDGATLEKKKEAWEKVTRLFNANSETQRQCKQLRKFWDNLKQK